MNGVVTGGVSLFSVAVFSCLLAMPARAVVDLGACMAVANRIGGLNPSEQSKLAALAAAYREELRQLRSRGSASLPAMPGDEISQAAWALALLNPNGDASSVGLAFRFGQPTRELVDDVQRIFAEPDELTRRDLVRFLKKHFRIHPKNRFLGDALIDELALASARSSAEDLLSQVNPRSGESEAPKGVRDRLLALRDQLKGDDFYGRNLNRVLWNAVLQASTLVAAASPFPALPAVKKRLLQKLEPKDLQRVLDDVLIAGDVSPGLLQELKEKTGYSGSKKNFHLALRASFVVGVILVESVSAYRDEEEKRRKEKELAMERQQKLEEAVKRLDELARGPSLEEKQARYEEQLLDWEKKHGTKPSEQYKSVLRMMHGL